MDRTGWILAAATVTVGLVAAIEALISKDFTFVKGFFMVGVTVFVILRVRERHR